VSTLGLEDFAAANALPEHTDGIIDELKRVERGRVVVLLREQGPGDWRISLRSLEADVVAICRRYKGGGHKLAAGCEVKGGAQELRELFAREALRALEDCRAT
jgi:nanoRNase/pAp phosphatase (c-di-AMP/oligoRNAs hydrolase)